MLRKDLVTKLKLVAPSLAVNDLIPILAHYWFTGTHLMAYNDAIAISTPFKSEFKGALPGKTLLDELSACRAKEVEFVATEKDVKVKCGGSRINLNSMPPTAFPKFEIPKGGMVLPVDMGKFLECVKLCLRSTNNDTSQPDQLGVSLIQQGKELHLYSTNFATISHTKTPIGDCTWPSTHRVILSKKFCEQMLEIGNGKSKLEIFPDGSLLTTGTDKLFGRLIQADQPLNFIELLKQHIPTNYAKASVPVPDRMRFVLDRAVIITDNVKDQTTTSITITSGKMKFVSRSNRGEVIDSVPLEGKQPDTSIELHCKHLRAGYGDFDRMLVTENVFIMSKGPSYYLISKHGD